MKKKIRRKRKAKKPNDSLPTDLGTENLLKILETEIMGLADRIRSGRIRNVEKEEIRIKNLRTLGYLCKIHKEFQESLKMEAIQKEMGELRQIVAANGDRHD